MTNPERKGWRTVRAVVEVAVQGDYTEKDLVWDVRACLDERMGQTFRRRHATTSKYGAPRVKEFGRFVTAEKKRSKQLLTSITTDPISQPQQPTRENHRGQENPDQPVEA